MNSVIITAANSFIGRRLCREFSDREYFVYAVIKNNCRNSELLEGLKNVKIIRADMDEYKGLSQKIVEKCDTGILLAWDGTRGKERNDSLKQGKNLKCSMNALRAFSEIGCHTVVTAGSQAEYGPKAGIEKVRETDECCPNTEYGKYKLEFYHQAFRYCNKKQIRLIEPRYFSLYGDDDSKKTMIISLVRNMLNNSPCKLTECIQQWDFLLVDDAVSGLIQLIEDDYADGIYNFGSGISRPLREYVEEIKKLTGSKSELLYGAVPYPDTGIVNTNPSVDKLKKAVSWDDIASFNDGISGVIEKQRKLMEDEKNQYCRTML